MGLHFTYVIFLFTVCIVASQAELSPEQYWKTTLPNTPIPRAVSDLLQTDFTDDKSTSVTVGKGSGVNVNTGNGKSGSTHVSVGKGSGVNVNTGKPGGGGTHVSVGKGSGVNVNTGKPGGGGTHVSVGKGSGVNVNTGKPGKGGTHVGVGKGGVSVNTGHKGKPVRVGVDPHGFIYKYAASENQLKTDPSVALFFLEKDLRPGTRMSLKFYRASTGGKNFLPRQLADSVPFSSEKLPEILPRFAVEPQSPEAEAITQTIKECETPATQGEEKYCATSLEGMVDFTTSKLGKSVEAISTEAGDESGARKTYTVTRVSKKSSSGAEKSVVCHKQTYAYPVFYCHATRSARAYSVSLEGTDGSRAEAVAVCHTDTSGWNPKHLAFQVLKVNPGTVPVCHFLPEDHVVWVPKKSA